MTQTVTIKSEFDAATCADNLTKAERSLLLYAETCAVDRKGQLDARRMNDVDIAALQKFNGVLLYFIANGSGVVLRDEGWAVVGLLRRRRAERASLFIADGAAPAASTEVAK